MRARTALLLALSIATTVVTSANAQLKLPDYERHELENGLRLVVLERPTIPMVSFELWIDVGASADPDGRFGLASLTAAALRKGAGDRDASQIAEQLDHLGAELSESVDEDRTRIALDLLSKDFDTGLSILGDLIRRPRFDEDEMTKLAGQSADQIKQSKDNPRHVLSDYHRAHLFGSHPYGNAIDGDEESLRAIESKSLKKFHADHYGANRILLVVAGDVDAKSVRSAVEAVFGDMEAAPGTTPTIPAPEAPAGSRVLLVNKSDTPQTWFQIGSLGPAVGQEDYAAYELVRTIFGGRFTSWLNQELRIKSGLTYGAGYRVNRQRAVGSAYISSFTATESTREAIDLALATLDRLHEEGVGEEDLASAKAYLKGQTPYEYETASDLAWAIASIEFYGLGRETVDGLFAAIDAVTLEDCRRVIDERFERENLVFTCIGVADQVSEILASYGPLSVRENSATGFHATEASSTVNR